MMASCTSPPKKRPKLSLKFMRKDHPPAIDDDEDVSSSFSHRGSSGRNRHNSAPNGHANTTSSTVVMDPFTTPIPSGKNNQLEVVHSPPAPFAGLQNLGNTCYLNSVLQALRFCPGFSRGLYQLTRVWEGVRAETGAEEGGGDNDRRGCGWEMQFVMNLKKLYDKMSVKEVDFIADSSSDVPISLSPDEVLETVRELNPMFQGFLQHDSQELLCCLLSYVLEACQNLKKQLVKLHPPSPHHAKDLKSPINADSNYADETTSQNELCGGSGNGKCEVSDEKSENRRASNTEIPDMNGKSSKLDLPSSASDQKQSTVSGNGDTTPITSNGKKTPRRKSRTPSSGSVVDGKSKTPSSVDGKANGNFMNGFGDHSRTAGPDGKKSGKENRETPRTNVTDQPLETSVKKKRLGKFRVPANQTTLLSAFAPLKKAFVLPNGLRKDLEADKVTLQVNGIDSDCKSDIKSNGMTDGPDRVNNGQTVPPDETKSENILNAMSDTKLKKTSSMGVNSSRKPSTSTGADRNSATDDCTAVNDNPNSQVDSMERELELIQGLFQGALVLRTRCNECESNTERREEFQDISLPVQCIPRSMGDEEDEGVPEVSPADLSLSWAISEFACVERLTDDNKYFCEHCRHHAEAERSMLFGELPPVLTIHLKRFSAFAGFLTANSTVSKVNDHLATPLSLCLSQWCAKQCKQLHCTYNLCAVVMHSGVSSSSGHYITYAQIPDQPVPSERRDRMDEGDSKSLEPRWGKFDDEKVSVLTQQEMASSVLHPVSSSGGAATPYLLFYRQIQESD